MTSEQTIAVETGADSIEAVAPRSSDWARPYARRLLMTDFAVVVIALVGAQLIYFGMTAAHVTIFGRLRHVELTFTTLSIVLVIAWLIALQVSGSRSARAVGTGSSEFRKVVTGSLVVFTLTVVIAYFAKASISRGFLITALLLGLVGLVASRRLWRYYLTRRRNRGEMMSRALLVGSLESVSDIHSRLRDRPYAGLLVVGVCIPGGASLTHIPDTTVAVLGDVNSLLPALAESGADTVIVTSSQELSSEGMRQLSWSLEPGRQHLVVAPGLTDIAGPRIHTRSVAGLPLVHVETPQYEGVRSAAKRVFDIIVSTAMIILLALPLAGIALVTKLVDRGPVFFRQTRVGLNGAEFSMLKFRSMVIDAEAKLPTLAEHDAGNSIMFKMIDDPRVTPLGRLLRRFSLDELPQLFNVLFGQMSLVGPRPPLPAEVALYENHVNRRFFVKPGITGLWQVSGRSNLNWAETVRLDLYYVENWSLTGDLVIMWQTIRAVLSREGAF